MSTPLGAALAAMATSRQRWTTFSGTFRTLDNPRLFHAAMSTRRGSRQLLGREVPELPDERRTEVRVWIGRNGEYREENVDGEGERRVTVVVGERWWLLDPRRGLLINRGDDQHGVGTFDVSPHLDPIRLVAWLDMGRVAETELGEAPVWHLGGVVRTPLPGEPDMPLHDYLFGAAQDVDLWVDQQFGVALVIEHRIGADRLRRSELIDAVFDADLSADLFEVEPDYAGAVSDTADAEGHLVTLAEARQLASFTVCPPTYHPAGADTLAIRFIPAGFFAPDDVIRFTGGRGATAITVAQTAAETADDHDLEWERRGHEGEVYDVLDGEYDRLVATTIDGTRVVVQGTVELETLLRVAASCRPG